MLIRVEKGSAKPVSRQIAEQIRAQCLAGIVRPGQLLPSVRQLAKELVVNVNTIVRVYERLAAEGLVEMRHGEGTYVLPQPAAAAMAAELHQQRGEFIREYQAVVRRGLLLGLTPPELRQLLTTAVSEAKQQLVQQHRQET